MSREDKSPIQIYIPIGLREWFDDYSKRQGLTRTAIIILLLERQRLFDKASEDGGSILEGVAGSLAS